MSAGVQARIIAASAYLDVAPTVVEVARDLNINPPTEQVSALDATQQKAAEELAEQWNLGGSMQRAISALRIPRG